MARIGAACNTAWRNFRLHFFLNSLALLTSALAYFILFLGLLFYLNLGQMLGRISSGDTLAVFISEEATAPGMKAVRTRLESLQLFSEITYISPAEARQLFLSRYSDLATALEELGENPFPPSFVAKLDPARAGEGALQRAASALQGFPGVSGVQSGSGGGEQGYVGRLLMLITGLALFCLVVCVLFLISNTIQLNFYHRRDEVGLLRLVGAGDTFVRRPFLLEGALISGGGAALALLALYLFYRAFLPPAAGSLPFLLGAGEIRFLPWWSVSSGLLGAAGLGCLASFFALGRFLDER